MELQTKDNKVIIEQDSSFNLIFLKKVYIFFQTILTIIIVIFYHPCLLILYLLFSIGAYVGYKRDKNIKFILEKMVIDTEKIEIYHIVDNEVTEQMHIFLSDVKSVEYVVPFFLGKFEKTPSTRNSTDKRRFLKIITMDNKIFSYGFF